MKEEEAREEQERHGGARAIVGRPPLMLRKRKSRKPHFVLIGFLFSVSLLCTFGFHTGFQFSLGIPRRVSELVFLHLFWSDARFFDLPSTVLDALGKAPHEVVV